MVYVVIDMLEMTVWLLSLFLSHPSGNLQVPVFCSVYENQAQACLDWTPQVANTQGACQLQTIPRRRFSASSPRLGAIGYPVIQWVQKPRVHCTVQYRLEILDCRYPRCSPNPGRPSLETLGQLLWSSTCLYNALL